MTISKTMRIEEDLKLFSDKAKMKKTGLNRMNQQQAEAWNNVYDPIIKHFYESDLHGKELIKLQIPEISPGLSCLYCCVSIKA